MQIPPGYEGAAIEGIRKAMRSNVEDLKKSFNKQGITFYVGIFFFIAWHLCEMYSATN